MRRTLRLSRLWCAAVVLSAAISAAVPALYAQQPQSAGGNSGQRPNVGGVQPQSGAGNQAAGNQANGTYQKQLQQQQQQPTARPGNPVGAGNPAPQATQPNAAVGANAQTNANAQPNAGQIVQMSPEQAAAALSKQPFPPLSPQFEQYLEQVLTHWEKSTQGVTQYECTFKRFQYDPSLQANDAFTVASGSLKYMQPDKGLFRVDSLYYHQGRDAQNKPIYNTDPKHQFGEYWICDGKYVHMMDRDQKICTKIELPPEMQGQSIYNSPLPFLFGVNAQQIKERYWVQPLVPPADRQKEVWLEAWPRHPNDAANYQRVQVVIDQNDWMPKGLIVFLPNWRPEAPHRELYEFEDRKNLSGIAGKLNPLNMLKEFIPDNPPAGWKTIVEPYQAPPAQQEPKVAQPPQAQPVLK